MANQVIAIVPSKERHVYCEEAGGKGREFKTPAQVIPWLDERRNGGTTVLALMGGAGQDLFGRILEMGMSVQRIPMFQIQAITALESKASAEDRAAALHLVWENNSEVFYPLQELDQTVVMIRELTRQRLNVQEFRKTATLQLYGALRSLEYVLSEEATALVKLLQEGLKDLFRRPELREQIEAEFRRLETAVNLSDLQQGQIFAIRRFFSNPRFVLGAKEDEQELEKQISKLLKHAVIWQQLHGASGLPALKGFGPAIGGAIISEIGDIRRFPSPEALRAYARFHVNPEGKFPYRQIGEISPFNRYLSRAVWLWSSDQVARYDHVWKSLYLWKKVREMQAHPETVARTVLDKKKRSRMVYDFTLKHLDSRAKRWTGSQLLNYLWDLWQEVATGRDIGMWYVSSSWPAYFAKAEQELNSGLLAYLEAETPKRRRADPKEKDVEEEE